MKLKELAAKPKLVKVVIDNKEIVDQYGEIEFYTWDRQPMHVFMKLAAAGDDDRAAMFGVLRTMILDEKGEQILVNETTIPTDVLVAAMHKISEMMVGKPAAETSTHQASDKR